jgi:thioredoxin 1
MNAIELTSENFDEQVLRSSKPVVVDFWAPWCGPCLRMSKSVDALAKEYADKIVVGKLNVDNAPDLQDRFKVKGIPQFLLFVAGEEVCRVVGAVPLAGLKKAIDASLADGITAADAQEVVDKSTTQAQQELQAKLMAAFTDDKELRAKLEALQEKASPYTNAIAEALAGDKEKLEKGELSAEKFTELVSGLAERLKSDEKYKEAAEAYEQMMVAIMEAMATLMSSEEE